MVTQSKWNNIPFGDLTENYDALRLPVKESDRRPGTYPYYGASGIVDWIDNYIFDGEYLLVAEDGENLKSRKLPVAFMTKGRFWVNNHAHIVKGNGKADTRFLMYAMRKADVTAYLTGSTMPKLTQGNLNRIPIYTPPLPEQKAIASILGALDDKIELNRKMNETLEAMARAIFKSWFVDFDPIPGLGQHKEWQDLTTGRMPKGWNVKELGTITEVVDCLHTKKPERQSFGKPLLQLWNIRDDGLIDMSDTYCITEKDYTRWISRIEASPGDCVITNVGRVGAVAQIPQDLFAALGRNMTGIRCRNTFQFPTFLIECLLSSSTQEEISLRTDTGTILNALNVKNIPKLRFIQPPSPIIEFFENTCRPLRAKMEKNIIENSALTTIRDALLPKLLSGKILVKDGESKLGL